MKIEFSEEEISYLNHTRCFGFVADQPERFFCIQEDGLEKIIEWEKTKKIENGMCKSSSLAFFSTFLEAKIYQSHYKDKHEHCYILHDEGGTGEWCVWLPVPLY